MRTTKWKYILQTLVVVSVLAALLVFVTGCKKKKPDVTEPSSTGETTTETTGPVETTTETTGPVETTTETTGPVETTTETTAAVCEHVLGNWIVEERSNCTKEGSRYKECTLCKEKVETEAIPKTDHTPSGWLGDKATCTAQSAQYQKCTQCDEKLVTIVVDKADHRTYEVKGQGYTVGYQCKDCNFEQKQYEIPAAGTVPYQTQESGSTCTITGLGNWTGSELIIPATINNKTVTGIGSNAFANLTSIKTVYIPKTVTEIGEKAFSGCSALTNIVYEGTALQWSTSVTKGAQWNQNTGSYQICCNNRILSK